MAEGKRILIISYYFAPQNVIGAVRPTKLAKYLSRLGHEVTVICGEGITPLKDPTLAADLAELGDVHLVREWNPIRDRKQQKGSSSAASGEKPGLSAAPRNKASFKGRILDKAHLLMLTLSDWSFQRRAMKMLGGMKQPFDAVISSFGPMSCPMIARKAKKQGLVKVWIADFRDRVSVSFSFLRGHAMRQTRKILKEADGISAVSQGVLQAIQAQDRGRILPNGFDREDLRLVRQEDRDAAAPFRFVYCGQLYAGRSDFTPFFQAMSDLMAEGLCSADRAEIIYAGGQGTAFRQQAESAGMEALVQDWGWVTREKSLSLQKSADALLLASWNQQGDTGVLTGKLLEYLMMEKPIVCCMSGDVSGSEVSALLHGTETGFCYEQANGQDDYGKLKLYLRELLTQDRQGVQPRLSDTLEIVGRFSYPKIAAEISEWAEELANENRDGDWRKAAVH